MAKEWKKGFVEGLSQRMKGSGVVGIADVGRLPSKQMQAIRRGLRGKAEIKVVKRSLLKRALEMAGLELLTNYVAQQPALITSELDAFELFREVKNMRSQAPAKPGMTATRDVVIKQGGTGLPPGPAIGDLQAAGIPARIEKGQIVVSKDHVILKAGDVVTPEISNALAKLDMKPFELGLEVTAILDRGVLFERDVLDIDIEEFRNRFATASAEAFALAKNTGYPVKEVLGIILSEMAMQAKSLALFIDWVSGETVKEILSKANAQALSLKKVGGV